MAIEKIPKISSLSLGSYNTYKRAEQVTKVKEPEPVENPLRFNELFDTELAKLRGNKTVHKKILPEFFETVFRGVKTFELRRDEDDIQVGDTVYLKEWDGDYSGRTIKVVVSYIIRGYEGLEPGYCIFCWDKGSMKYFDYENEVGR